MPHCFLGQLIFRHMWAQSPAQPALACRAPAYFLKETATWVRVRHYLKKPSTPTVRYSPVLQPPVQALSVLSRPNEVFHGPCAQGWLFPAARDLLTRFRGRPFAFVSGGLLQPWPRTFPFLRVSTPLCTHLLPFITSSRFGTCPFVSDAIHHCLTHCLYPT